MIPSSIYRLSFGKDLDFKKAKSLVEYLHQLGVGALYASPIMKSARGREHGYHVTDPLNIDPDLGTEKDIEELSESLKRNNMGWIQDFVPNHVSYDHSCTAVLDTLRFGEYSQYCEMLDIDWMHPAFDGKVLAPFIGGPLNKVLENNELELESGQDGIFVKYFDRSFPLSIESYKTIIAHLIETGYDRDYLDKVSDMINDLPTSEVDRCKELNRIYEKSSDLPVEQITEQNGKETLKKILDQQHFVLDDWRRASREINYRRFFTINDLICLDMKKQSAFEWVHEKILSMIERGIFSGLRVDHIDGIEDPEDYLNKLRSMAGSEPYIVIEKILSGDERLPDWPVEGTTGYDFIKAVNGLFWNKEGRDELDKLHFETGGEDPERLVRSSKMKILEEDMKGEVKNLIRLAGLDSSDETNVAAMNEYMASMEVYRTYSAKDELDDSRIRQAFDSAVRSNPHLVFGFGKISTLMRENERFSNRFQQYTPVLMAKGFEDTFLYRYNRLIAFNEVGGDPIDPGISIDQFHDFNLSRSKRWPHTVNSTSTHDTKWGEDARARLAVISDMGREWRKSVHRWMEMNCDKKSVLNGSPVPSDCEEYRIYQTMVGSMPFDPAEYVDFYQRLRNHIVKYLREAKINSSWIEPDEEYENQVVRFFSKLLEDRDFLEDLDRFVSTVKWYGIFNSLTQTLLKMTSPGIPDFYRGSEIWNLCMVDPDNRRAIDFSRTKRVLKEISESNPDDVIIEGLRNPTEGKLKMLVISKVLRFRNLDPDLFSEGEYVPLEVDGERREKLISFMRKMGGREILVAAPLHIASFLLEGVKPVGKVWEDTGICLPEDEMKEWKCIFTGKRVYTRGVLNVDDAFEKLPLCLLERSE